MRHTVEQHCDRLVFLDLETMGLLPTSPIVQIGIVIARRVGWRMKAEESLEIVVPHSESEWKSAQEGAAVMHGASGLRQRSIDEYEARQRPRGWPPFLSMATREAIDFLTEAGFGPGEAIIAGNSVGMDRVWLAVQMPHLHAYLHHRMVDVSAFRTVAQMFGEVPARKSKEHTAVADCHAAIDEMSFYLARFAVWAERH